MNLQIKRTFFLQWVRRVLPALLIMAIITGCQSKNESSVSVLIDGERVSLNGFLLTPGGSIDELINTFGAPDYIKGPGYEHVFYWKDLGLKGVVKEGCLLNFSLRVTPLTADEIDAYDRRNFPGKRPMPAFPGYIEVDGVEITSNLTMDEFIRKKRPPALLPDIPKGGLFRQIKGLPGDSYSVEFGLVRPDYTFRSVTYEHVIEQTCQSRPIITKESLKVKPQTQAEESTHIK